MRDSKIRYEDIPVYPDMIAIYDLGLRSEQALDPVAPLMEEESVVDGKNRIYVAYVSEGAKANYLDNYRNDINYNRSHFKRMVNDYIRDNNLMINEFTAKIEVNTSTFKSWLNGRYRVPQQYRSRIANVLGVNKEELFKKVRR